MYALDEKTKKIIEQILDKGDRVELIPTNKGIKVLKVRREEIKKGEKTERRKFN